MNYNIDITASQYALSTFFSSLIGFFFGCYACYIKKEIDERR